MLKSVRPDSTTAHLHDELGNFICSYDAVADQTMFRFVHRLVAQGDYLLEQPPQPDADAS